MGKSKRWFVYASYAGCRSSASYNEYSNKEVALDFYWFKLKEIEEGDPRYKPYWYVAFGEVIKHEGEYQ